MKRPLPIKNEIRVLLAFRANPNKGINEIWKTTGLHRKTFFETKKRLEDKKFITYQTNGKGKKATATNITDLGRSFLCSLPRFKELLNAEGLFTHSQLQKTKSILNADMALGGKLRKWKCRFHPEAEVSYNIIKNRDAFTYCQEKGCKNSGHWVIVKPNFSDNNSVF